MKKQINKWHLMLLTFCVLLITILASIFDLNATPQTTSNDDEESTVDNWEISIVFYDSTIGNGKTPLTEYNWNSLKHDEVRDIIIQINYKNTNTVTSYKANDLKILIPKLQVYNGYTNVYDITAGSLANEFNWKYSYSGNNILLQNNIPIEEKTNLEGSIQLSFRPTPIQLANNTIQEFKATLSDKKGVIAESNTITFNYTSERKEHSVIKTANKVQGYDRMPEGADNYIWIRWHVDVYADVQGVRSIYLGNHNYYRKAPEGLENSIYFIEHVPVDAIVLDSNMQIVENNNGEARIDTYTHGYYYLDAGYRAQSDIYIGYPKETYQNQKIENTIDVYGIYWDETEHTYLCSDTKVVNAADYAFTGYGRLYWHSKGNSGIISSDKAKFNYSPAQYSNNLDVRYTGTPMTIELADDLMIAPNADNNYDKLNDDEYYFSGLDWIGGVLINANRALIQPYDMEVWVRYEGETEFVLFQDGLKANQSYQNADRINFMTADKHVVSWKVMIYDVEESILSQWSYMTRIFVNIATDDISDHGYVYNFTYMKVYFGDEWQNPASLSHYATEMTQMDVATHDIETYGVYLNRAVGKGEIKSSIVPINIGVESAASGKLSNNIKTEQFEGVLNIRSSFNTSKTTFDSFTGFSYYSLLPIGMDYISIKSMDKLAVPTTELKTHSGILLTNDYVLNHINVTTKENWKGTGRTLLIINYDFSDDPIDLSTQLTTNGNGDNTYKDVAFVWLHINVGVSYDAYLEYGSSYTVQEWFIFNDIDNENFFPVDHTDNTISLKGSQKLNNNVAYDELDLNENGQNEIMETRSTSFLISDLVVSHQDVQIQVQSDVSNFSTGTVDAPSDSIYTYKLRVRTGNSDVTNFILYCNLENVSQRPQWKGYFQGIDTSFASKTYNIKVYYSEKKNAGTLAEDNSWKEYDEATVDKTKAQSFAFEYLDNEGNPALLPSGTYTYVLIKMKAPLDEYTTLAYNRCWTQWNAVDEFNRPVDFITGIQSNIVKVALPSSVKGMWKTVVNITFNKVIHGEKIDFDNMNLNQFNNYNFQITLTNQETGDVHSGLLSSQNGLTFGLLPAGTYLITESDDNYFDFIEMVDGSDSEIIMEGITFEKVGDDYLLTILEDVEEDIYFQVNITNKIEDNRFYEDKNDRENYFLINKNDNNMMDPDDPQGH